MPKPALHRNLKSKGHLHHVRILTISLLCCRIHLFLDKCKKKKRRRIIEKQTGGKKPIKTCVSGTTQRITTFTASSRRAHRTSNAPNHRTDKEEPG